MWITEDDDNWQDRGGDDVLEAVRSLARSKKEDLQDDETVEELHDALRQMTSDGD